MAEDEGERSVVAAVIVKDGAYLVCRRPLHKRHGGLWEFPGGKVEEGESLLEAARRELSEELDLSAIKESGQVFSVKDPASGFMINFVEIEVEGEPTLLEHIECAWLPPSQLSSLDLAPSDRKFVEYISSPSF
jgi:8-oxo-dGTP pyrophosphatase MutT (NUDIX family)